MADHPWEASRPISAWVPGGWSETKGTKISRNERPVIEQEKCHTCNICWIYCPDGAISRGDTYSIDYKFCRGCGICAEECPRKAISMIMEGGN